MPDKPNTADGYGPDQLQRVRATCLYVATKLGDLMDEVVVVGGLVPSLLIDQDQLPPNIAQHAGTMDLDLGLAFTLIGEQRYQAIAARLREADFAPDDNAAGNPTRQRWRIDNPRVTVDFLIEPDDLAEMGSIALEEVDKIVGQAEVKAEEAERAAAEQRRLQRQQDQKEAAEAALAEEAAQAAEAAGTAEAAETAETAEAAETAETAETPEAAETAEPAETAEMPQTAEPAEADGDQATATAAADEISGDATDEPIAGAGLVAEGDLPRAMDDADGLVDPPQQVDNPG